LHKKVIAELTL